MSNWKKLIVSGSHAELASVTATAGAIVTGSVVISGSGNGQLTVIGSGSLNPIFKVQGSLGELFAVTDSMSGSLFSVNDISGLPILEVFSDNRIIMGDIQAPSLYTTKRNALSTGVTTIYSFPTDSYNSVHVEYNCVSASNGRAGTFTAFWIGSTIRFTEVSTVDIGNSATFFLSGSISGGNFNLQASASSASWVLKTIIRGV
jgi:hypothetical protein